MQISKRHLTQWTNYGSVCLLFSVLKNKENSENMFGFQIFFFCYEEHR